MASITGIELKPDSCVLAAIRPSRHGLDVSAVHTIAPADWPGQDLALADALRSVRIRKRMPRRARVVVWGLPDHGSADDPATLALLRPFTTAGFKVQSAVTPPQALTALAARRPRETGGGAVAWLTLNTHGTAIAIVRDGELLYSRTFDWLYRPGEAGSTAQLLQRYTLVAHLAPELRYGMSRVHAAHGVRVETAVTCGDLPDLRSLTMPLIEELDLEVETLDSTDGLHPVGRAKQERFAELAPAMRLACATAAIAPSRARAGGRVRRWIPTAATAVLITGGVAYVYWSTLSTEAPQSAAVVRPSTPKAAAGTQGRSEPGGAAQPGRSAAPTLPAASPSPPQQAARSLAPGPSPPVAVSSPIGTVRQAPAQKPGPPADKPMARVAPALPPPTHEPVRMSPPAITPQPAPAVPPVAAPPPVAWGRGRAPRETPTVQPLKEALPRVDSILIDRERRLAIIEGRILGVGDAVGSRRIVQIERDGLILREPSGLEIRVRLRSFGSDGVI